MEEFCLLRRNLHRNKPTVMNKVRRFKGSNPLQFKYVNKTVKHPLKIMIWGCFSYHGVGRLYVCDGTMTSEKYLHVLQEKLLPSIHDFEISNPFHLDDSARCHWTLAVKEWHKENKINQTK